MSPYHQYDTPTTGQREAIVPTSVPIGCKAQRPLVITPCSERLAAYENTPIPGKLLPGWLRRIADA